MDTDWDKISLSDVDGSFLAWLMNDPVHEAFLSPNIPLQFVTMWIQIYSQEEYDKYRTSFKELLGINVNDFDTWWQQQQLQQQQM